LSHTRLEGYEAQRPVRVALQVCKEPRKLLILKVGRFLSLGPGPLGWWELPNGIRVRKSVEDRRLQAGAKDTQVLRSRRGRATTLAQHEVEACDVFGAYPPYSLTAEYIFGVHHRRTVGTHRRGLALERGEPTVGPIDETNRRSRAIFAFFDRGLKPVQGDFSLMSVPSDSFLVCVVTDTDDDVVEGSLWAGAPTLRLVE
jgi:hypothetical protein